MKCIVLNKYIQIPISGLGFIILWHGPSWFAERFGILSAISLFLISSLIITFLLHRYEKSKLVEYLNHSVNSEADRFQRLMRKRGWGNIQYQDCRKIVKKYPKSAFVIGDESSYQYMAEYKADCPNFLKLVATRTHNERRKIRNAYHANKSYSKPLKAFLIFLLTLFLTAFVAAYFDQTEILRVSLLGAIMGALFIFTLVYNMIQTLRTKGYHWLTVGNGFFLFSRLGLKAKRLPPKSAVATLPNYNDYDVLSLVLLARNLK